MTTFLISAGSIAALVVLVFCFAHFFFHKVLAGVKALTEEPPGPNGPELAVWAKKPRRADDPCAVPGCQIHPL